MRLVHLSVERFQCIAAAELDFGPGLPTFFADPHEYFDMHVLIHPRLTAQPELAQDPIFFQ